MLVTVALRRISLRFNVLSPAEMDLTPKVVEGAQQMYNQAIEQGVHQSKVIERRHKRGAHDHRMILVHDKELPSESPMDHVPRMARQSSRESSPENSTTERKTD